MGSTIRPPAVAGTFYPSEPSQLEAEIRGYVQMVQPIDLDFPLRILIVPHAGYIYSGPVAATGYQLLAGTSDLRRIVMLGPSHYERFAGLALPGAELLETPLGTVAVESEGGASVAANPLVIDSAPVHAREHSLEVQLPFLQVLVPGVPVVPLLTGSIDPGAGADVVAPLLDSGTLLLVSSDLSHYHDAATARRLDAETAQAIVQLNPDALGWESACGRTGVQIALHLARRRGYEAELLDLRNSADTAGSPDRVVGYGTFAFGA